MLDTWEQYRKAVMSKDPRYAGSFLAMRLKRQRKRGTILFRQILHKRKEDIFLSKKLRQSLFFGMTRDEFGNHWNSWEYYNRVVKQEEYKHQINSQLFRFRYN